MLIQYRLEGNKMETRICFGIFRSNVCHELKELGDKSFLIEILSSNRIFKFWENERYPEALYLFAMLDYLSRINEIPLCEEFDEMRKHKLEDAIYLLGILTLSKLAENDGAKVKSISEAIPEFLRFNIVESGIRQVC